MTKFTTILSSVSNQRAYNMALDSDSEFRVLVRPDSDARDKYSAAVAMASKLKKPKGYPPGFAFALRVRPKKPIQTQGTSSDL